MNWRLIATTLGCACILGASAGIASHYVGRDSGRDTAQPIPLFVASAQHANPRPFWPPPEGSVAFNDEMIALLTMGASVSVAAREAMLETAEAQPPKPMSRQERRRAQQEKRARLRAERAQARDERGPGRDYRVDRETVEVHVKDRQGNSVRVQRVERELEDDRPRAFAPNPLRRFGPFGRW